MPNIRRNPGFRIPAQRPLLSTHSGICGLPAANPVVTPAATRISAYSPRPVPAAAHPTSLCEIDGALSPQRAKTPSGNMTCIRHPVPLGTAPVGLPRQQVRRPSPQTAKAPPGNMTCTRHPVTTLFPTARRRDSAAASIPSVARCDGYPPSSPAASTHPRVPDNGRLFLTARRCGSVRRPAAYGGTRYPPAHAMSKCAPIAPGSTRYTRNRSKRNAFAPIVICHRQVSPPRYFFSAGSTWQAFDPS